MEKEEVLAFVKRAITDSELAKEIGRLKNGLFKEEELRPLNKDEVSQLERQGNISEDWSKIKVCKDFSPERIRNSSFFGFNTIGAFKKDIEVEEGIRLPSGIYNSTIIDTEIGNNVLISDAKLISNSLIGKDSIVFNVGTIDCKDETTYGNGKEINIAIEIGGREVKIFSDITVEIAEVVAKSRGDKDFLKRYCMLIEEFLKAIKFKRTILLEGAIVKNTGSVSNAFIGRYCLIENAKSVENSTILSSLEERTEIKNGAYVVDSIIQWGCGVDTFAIVDSSVLIEHSHVERHGKVTESIIGANTGIAEGEVTASLVGPFVGFHHQALLIAALWPEGKGNVGYGANVGSNHTSKSPDQEIWPGEGMFFGLGVNIKFPADYTKSPYSIIATGVNTLPQKVEFPFSLINTPRDSFPGISPAFNEILPGWVLSDNIYTVKRNEGKYKKRNKAKRTKIVFDVFRPEIIDLMLDARERLKVEEIKKLYTSKDIKGLGKNYLLEEKRKKGVEAYTFYIRYYALLELKKMVENLLLKGKRIDNSLLKKKSKDLRWEHAREILNQEIPGSDVKENIKLLQEMQEKIANDIKLSKEKDDKRGVRIIDDYAESHLMAKDDPFVKETLEESKKIQSEIKSLLEKID